MKPQGNVPMVPRHVNRDATEHHRQESFGRKAADASDSLSGQPPFDSLRALQDMVSALEPQSAALPPQPARISTPDETLIKFIAACASGTRTEAIKSLVQQIAKQFPAASIQAGIGSKHLRRFLDSTLGWLGPESELFRELAQTWRTLHGVAPPQDRSSTDKEIDADPSIVDSKPVADAASISMPHDSSVITLPSGEFVAVLRRPGNMINRGDDCILIKLSGPEMNAEVASQFNHWSAALAPVIWNRPSWKVPQWVYLNGNRRVIAATVTAALVVATLFPTPYRVKADVRIEPQSPRIVSAPFEAMIQDVLVHPGDIVKAGQTLLTLDGRPLRLERQSLEAEIYQSAKQKDIALAAGRIAEAQQAQLKYQQLLRRRDLIDRRLEQLTVSSPIDGVVVSGDLRRSVGASLELGRVLLEIAPLNRVLVEIAIPEYEISMVETDAKARIRVDASGVPTIDQSITEIYPAGELREDEVVFISLIELDNSDGAFRPGMTGKATVYGDYRPFVWPYMRRAIDQITWLIGL
jgi:multidrug efflux pump subunit AcrA (membrane-fusion protein)